MNDERAGSLPAFFLDQARPVREESEGGHLVLIGVDEQKDLLAVGGDIVSRRGGYVEYQLAFTDDERRVDG